MKKQLTILWGTSGFWKWLAEFIIREFSEYVDITITGTNSQKGRDISNEIGANFVQDNRDAVKDADIVIYSVPIALTEKVIWDTIDVIKTWAIIGDVTSIKKFPSKAMKKCQQKDVIVIPTHPMFGPYISRLGGQIVALTPDETVRNTQAYKILKSYLEKEKVKVIETSPEYHDKMMAVVQGLTHFNMFALGETLNRLDFDITESLNFVSPIYKLMISSVCRYVGQNPGLYADIQMYNDEIMEVHQKFLETSQDFHAAVKNKDYNTFCQDILEARESIGIENCEKWQEYTDKVIYLMWKQIDILKRNLWKQISLKNIYTLEEVTGVLESFNEQTLKLQGKGEYKIDIYDIREI